MTKKAMRRKIMESVGYPDKRVEYIESCGEEFTYKRDGELLKEELKAIISYLDGWDSSLDNSIKGAWRRKIRNIVEIKYDNFSDGCSKFSEHELIEILRKTTSQCNHRRFYDSQQQEYYCPVCDEQ